MLFCASIWGNQGASLYWLRHIKNKTSSLREVLYRENVLETKNINQTREIKLDCLTKQGEAASLGAWK